MSLGPKALILLDLPLKKRGGFQMLRLIDLIFPARGAFGEGSAGLLLNRGIGQPHDFICNPIRLALIDIIRPADPQFCLNHS